VSTNGVYRNRPHQRSRTWRCVTRRAGNQNRHPHVQAQSLRTDRGQDLTDRRSGARLDLVWSILRTPRQNPLNLLLNERASSLLRQGARTAFESTAVMKTDTRGTGRGAESAPARGRRRSPPSRDWSASSRLGSTACSISRTGPLKKSEMVARQSPRERESRHHSRTPPRRAGRGLCKAQPVDR
jgi:hypothetical protein